MDSLNSAFESTRNLALDAMDAIDLRMSSISSLNFYSDDMDDSLGKSRRSRFASSSHSSSFARYSQRTLNEYDDVHFRGAVFQGAVEALSVREKDLKQMLDREGELESLKKSLRKQGAVTNSMIKQGLHLYVMQRNMENNAKSRRTKRQIR